MKSRNEVLPNWSYLSDSSGLKGNLKEEINDFKVKEVADHKTNGGDHVIIKLTKYDRTTLQAIDELSKILHISRKRFGYAGNKDKRAVTTQYVSIKGVDEDKIKRVYMPGLEIEVVGKNDYIAIGQLESNHFEVVVRNINFPKEDIEDRVFKIYDEMNNLMPNYFGRQRFGSTRSINHIVGRELLKGNYGKAVWTYIAMPFEDEHKKVKRVRKKLWDSRDPTKAAESFPKEYKFEKSLLYQLAKDPQDYLGAFKHLPEGLQRLFIHAYQSYVYNKALSHIIDEGMVEKRRDYKLPLVGYKTALKDEEPESWVKEILEEDGVEQEDFKLRSLPSLRSEGDYRRCFVPVDDLEVMEIDSDDLNINKNKVKLSFKLGKGSYATTFLREITKSF